MKTVTLQPFGSTINVRTGTHVSTGMLSAKCKMAMACGGQGLCATCHVYVTAGEKGLSPMTERERQTLAIITGAQGNSRLSCQARILQEGVQVALPDGRYLSQVNDLLSQVGKRAQDNILHPRDGRVLIAKGKIITKSRILQLQDEKLDALPRK
jgi:ferredoxin